MTASSFAPALAFVLEHEGRCYTCDPEDPGGSTYFGITLAAYQTWTGNRAATVATLRAMSLATITAFYRALWARAGCDSLSIGVDLSVYDAHVNTGINAIRQLQRVAGIAGKACDGQLGPATLAALAALDAQAVGLRLKPDALRLLQPALGLKADGVLGPKTHAGMTGHLPEVLIAALYDQSVTYYRSLPDFPTYGDGWLTRTANRAQVALHLCTGG